jgi:hypothetical protein
MLFLGNKTTVRAHCALRVLLFWFHSRQRRPLHPFSLVCHWVTEIPWVGTEGHSMQRVASLLRSTPSRIRRRIAEFVAIAAASLPDVGA